MLKRALALAATIFLGAVPMLALAQSPPNSETFPNFVIGQPPATAPYAPTDLLPLVRGAHTYQLPLQFGSGLTGIPGTRNTGPTLGGIASLQLWPVYKSASYVVNSDFGGTSDSGALLIANGSGVTFTLPDPSAANAGIPYRFGSDGSNGYTLATVSGTATFSGCRSGGGTTLAVGAAVEMAVVSDGVKYHCSGGGGGAGGANTSLSILSTSPPLGIPTDSHIVDFNLTYSLAGQQPGFTDVGIEYSTFTLWHGDHTAGYLSGNGKTTAFNTRLDMYSHAAGQIFNQISNLNAYGSGDAQAYSATVNYFGGVQTAGDEGPCLFCGAIYQPQTATTTTITAPAVVGGGSTTTTAPITGSKDVQTVPVASSASFAAGEWVEVNRASPTGSQNLREAVQLTAVGSGTISGIFRNTQSSGVTVTPATVLTVSANGALGEQRYLVNKSGPSYTAGSIAWTPSQPYPTGSGTSWSIGMVGGDSVRPGCIAATGDQTASSHIDTYWPIASIGSATSMTTAQARTVDLTGGGAYTVRPCAEILRVIDNGTGTYTLVLETNTFAWNNGDGVEAADMIGNGGHHGITVQSYSYFPATLNRLLWLVENGPIAPSYFIELTNWGQGQPLNGAQQNAFIHADSSAHPGGVQWVFSGSKTNGLLNGTIAAGGSYIMDQSGIALSGLIDVSAGNRGNANGGILDLNPVWSNGGYHNAIGLNVADASSSPNSNLVDLQVNSTSVFAIDKTGTIIRGALGNSKTLQLNYSPLDNSSTSQLQQTLTYGAGGDALVNAVMSQISAPVTTTISGMPTRTTCSTTTTQTITGSATAQTVTVASSAGCNVGDWIEANHSGARANREAVQLTAVGAGSITGVFTVSQSSGTTITPALVLPLTSVANAGAGRYLVDKSGASYTTGTISWPASSSANPAGSGTAWSSGMVGSDSVRPGCIAATGDTTGAGLQSWWPITAVGSATSLTTEESRNQDLVAGAGAYQIRPCAEILKVLASSIVAETSPATWTSGDTVEVAVDPRGSALMVTLQDNTYTPQSTSSLVNIIEGGLTTPQKFINVVNSGAVIPGATANQSDALYVDSGPNHGSITRLFRGVNVAELGYATISAGGSVRFDNYGFSFSGLIDNGGTPNNRGVGPQADFEFDETWNAGTNVLTLLGANVSDTASGATSKLVDLRVGNVTKFQAGKDGSTIIAGSLTISGGSATLNNGTSNTIFFGPSGSAAPGANSIGEKIQFYGTSGIVAFDDYALGIESNNIWLNTNGGFKWYVASAGTADLTSTGLYLGNTTAPTNRLDVSGAAAIGTYAGTAAPSNGLIVSGNVGIANTSPSALLSVGRSPLGGPAASTIFNTNAGTLSATAASDLALASIGFWSGNQSSFGVHGYRTGGGGDWMTTALVVGMDVDAVVRAGAYMAFLANADVLVGTLTDCGLTLCTGGSGLSLVTGAQATQIANAGTTGTTLNKAAKLTGAPSTAVLTATTDTDGAVGVVVAGAGTTGSAQIATGGQAGCVFDGATTAGDWVGYSSTVAGDCHDAGATRPTHGIGRVLSTNAAGGTFAVLVAPF